MPEKLLEAHRKRAQADTGQAEALTWIGKADKLIGQMKAAGRKLLPLLVKPKKTGREAKEIGKLKQELERQQSELAEPIQKLQEQSACACCPADGSCFVAGTPMWTAGAPKPIDAATLLEGARTLDAEERREAVSERWRPDPERDRHVTLRLRRPEGSTVEVELVRGVDWLAAHTARMGGFIQLNLPEMGAAGMALVTGIGPCPPFDPAVAEDPSLRYVTGLFRHTASQVWNLALAGESEPSGVTGTHPFWSVDRVGWVAVVELRTGERVKTRQGTTKIESRILRFEAEPVYNLEIEGDHCYRVGESGVLVHNNSAEERQKCADCGPFGAQGINWCGADAGVADDSLEGLVRRLKGLMMGRTPAIREIKVFGSRAGSTHRGPGPLPLSDLDVLIIGTPGLRGSRWEDRITRIIADIDETKLHGTDIVLKIDADWVIGDLRFSDIGPPFIRVS